MSAKGEVIRAGDVDVVTADVVTQLHRPRAGPCVSIYLPTHTAGPATRQDPIRFRNLVRAAHEVLRDEHDLSASEIDLLFGPARQLATDREFWRHQSDGLAFFLEPDFFHTLRVPLPFREDVHVGPSFRVRPLLPLLSGDGHFYLLALSVNNVRVFVATRLTIAELALDAVPASMAEALAHEDHEAQLQVRAGGQAGMFHGHGVGDEVDKQALERFFRAVDRGLRPLLRSDPAPLVVAAVDYYLPIYRSITTHLALVDTAVAGSPERQQPRDLHAAAWDAVAPIFASARNDAVQRLRSALERGSAAAGAVDVAEAAVAGRVATLLLADDAPIPGHLQAGRATLQDDRHNGAVDLLEHAAVATLASGGTVFTDEGDAVPDGVGAAALLRW
jgi:Bacterial archaeo-eukaryotic release factor family 7